MFQSQVDQMLKEAIQIYIEQDEVKDLFCDILATGVKNNCITAHQDAALAVRGLCIYAGGPTSPAFLACTAAVGINLFDQLGDCEEDYKIAVALCD